MINTLQPVYNIEDYVQKQNHVLSTIHTSVREKPKGTKAERVAEKHKRAPQLNINHGHTIRIRQPDRSSNLALKLYKWK